MRMQVEQRSLVSVCREDAANTLATNKANPGESELTVLEAVSGAIVDCWRAAERAVAAAVADDQASFLTHHVKLKKLVELTVPLFDECDADFAGAATALQSKPGYAGLRYHSAHHALMAEVVAVVHIVCWATAAPEILEQPGDLVLVSTEENIRQRWGILRKAFCHDEVLDGSDLELQCEYELSKAREAHRILDGKIRGELAVKKIKPTANTLAIIRAIQSGKDNEEVIKSLGIEAAKSVGNVDTIRCRYNAGTYEI